MAGRPARESAYAELVAGLLDARDDVATARFDAELASAQEQGRIDADTARVLRWWQRTAVRAVVDHAVTALPPVLAALDRAHDVAVDDATEAARALDDAMAAALPLGPEPVPRPEAPGAPPTLPARNAPSVHGPDRGTAEEPAAAVDLTAPDLPARRLLVAGLTPLPPP
jgi:hypothetical protein